MLILSQHAFYTRARGRKRMTQEHSDRGRNVSGTVLSVWLSSLGLFSCKVETMNLTCEESLRSVQQEAGV